MQKNTLSYCGQVVRETAPERFLQILFAPAEARPALWALYAFAYEIAKTRDVVSESTLGLIRLQWWRDEIARLYDGGAPPDHPILQELREAITRYGLRREDFETLLYAREFDLEDVLPGNLEGLMNYADFTTTPLLRLAVTCMGADADMVPLQPLGINDGLAGVVRAMPYHARDGRCFLPEDKMRRADYSREDFSHARKPEILARIVEEIAGGFTPGLKYDLPFLRAVQGHAALSFSRFKSLKYNVFSPKFTVPVPFYALRLWACVALWKV